MKANTYKKYSLSLLCLITCLCAFGQDDHYFHFFYEHEGERYYLSAVDGGGDEVIAKRGKPGEYEKFHLQFVAKGDSITDYYRIKTANNYYLSLNEDTKLIAEEKETTVDQFFEVSKKLIKRERDDQGQRKIYNAYWELELAHVDTFGQRNWLTFFPGVYEFACSSTPLYLLSTIQAEEIRIEILTIQEGPQNREHEYRLLFVDADSTMMSCLYFQQIYVFDHLHNPNHLRLYPGQRETGIVLRKDPIHIHVQYRGDYGTSCPLPRMVLLKDERAIQSWTFDESLQNGQQIRLMMDGGILKMY